MDNMTDAQRKEKETEKYKARLQYSIDTYSRFKSLFSNKDFRDYMNLFASKAERYRQIRADIPRLGATKAVEHVTRDDKGQIISRTKVPVRVTIEDQINHVTQYDWRINEIELLHRLPEDLENGAKRAQAELDRFMETANKEEIKKKAKK